MCLFLIVLFLGGPLANRIVCLIGVVLFGCCKFKNPNSVINESDIDSVSENLDPALGLGFCFRVQF